MYRVLLVLTAVVIPIFCYGGSTQTGIEQKKAALERKYQKCMKYSRYKENCQKYRDIKATL